MRRRVSCATLSDAYQQRGSDLWVQAAQPPLPPSPPPLRAALRFHSRRRLSTHRMDATPQIDGRKRCTHT